MERVGVRRERIGVRKERVVGRKERVIGRRERVRHKEAYGRMSLLEKRVKLPI